MLSFQLFVCTFLVLVLSFSSTLQSRKIKPEIYPTIYVDPSGRGNFTTVQAAIDSVPSYNKRWTCIHVKKGVYREKVRIPNNKQFIYLKGEGKRKTYIVWDDHDSIATSATFTCQANNTIVKCITFVNSYNYPNSGSLNNNNPMRTAVAAVIQGDKTVFYRCGFFGLQDTLWDERGRHYFKLCTIQGAVDFIFGSGQSLYERCTISVVSRALNGIPGYITAQGRSHAEETNGFVFKDCNIVGNGKTFLGRPWREYARVVFYNTSMSDIVVPQGWDSWFSVGREYQLTFAEHKCRGLGSNTSKRVKWAKKLSEGEVEQLTRMSYIDNEGWMSKLAFSFLAA